MSGISVINRIRKSRQLPQANGISGGFHLDEATDRIRTSVKSSETYPRYVPAFAQVTTNGNFTITASDDGKNFVTTTTPVIASLPAVNAANRGMRVRLTVKGLASSGSGHAFSPAAVDRIYGHKGDNSAHTSVDNKDIWCTAATDTEGAFCELESDGVDGWIISAIAGIWTNEP